jgi:hypothetical protein
MFSLKPTKFKGHTHVYGAKKPTNKQSKSGFDKEFLGDEVPVYIDANQTISVWRTKNFWARLLFLFNGEITLQVMGKLPPVGLHIGEVIRIEHKIEKKPLP